MMEKMIRGPNIDVYRSVSKSGVSYEYFVTAANSSVMIDTDRCYIDSTNGYWDDFWNGSMMGKKIGVDIDPDGRSDFALNDSARLWSSRELPDGNKMDLSIIFGKGQLYWADRRTRYANDSITTSFKNVTKKGQSRGEGCTPEIREYIDSIGLEAWKKEFEKHLRDTYNAGGTTIFPVENSINSARGTDPRIHDRWDISLDCIRSYYLGKDDLMKDVLKANRGFFDMFGSFENFIDFLFLNDFVDSDYSVTYQMDELFPKNGDDFKRFMDLQDEQVKKRNERIKAWCRQNGI